MKPTDRITAEGAEAIYEVCDELEHLVLEIKNKSTRGRMVGDVARAPQAIAELNACLARLVACTEK